MAKWRNFVKYIGNYMYVCIYTPYAHMEDTYTTVLL